MVCSVVLHYLLGFTAFSFDANSHRVLLHFYHRYIRIGTSNNATLPPLALPDRSLVPVVSEAIQEQFAYVHMRVYLTFPR